MNIETTDLQILIFSCQEHDCDDESVYGEVHSMSVLLYKGNAIGLLSTHSDDYEYVGDDMEFSNGHPNEWLKNDIIDELKDSVVYVYDLGLVYAGYLCDSGSVDLTSYQQVLNALEYADVESCDFESELLKELPDNVYNAIEFTR